LGFGDSFFSCGDTRQSIVGGADLDLARVLQLATFDQLGWQSEFRRPGINQDLRRGPCKKSCVS
jgi:hypothetical protein